jgi:DNA polymerase III alpha subunit
MWINLKTEHSFGSVYGHTEDVAHCAAQLGTWAGIADKDATWGHVRWQKACNTAKIKPIYGVILTVVPEEEIKMRRARRAEVTLVAMDLPAFRRFMDWWTRPISSFTIFPGQNTPNSMLCQSQWQ